MKGSHLKKYLPYVVIIAGLLAFYHFRYRSAPAINFAELMVTQQDGNTIPLGSMMKEKCVIHFYASWCGPCIREMNELRTEWSTLRDEGIQIIFLTDDPENRIQPFRKQMPDDALFLQIPSLQDAGIYTIPTSYFLLNQKITSQQVDPVDWKNHEEIINRFKQ